MTLVQKSPAVNFQNLFNYTKFKKNIYCSWFTMFCQFLPYSKVTQSYIHIYIYTHTHILFSFFYHVLSQMIRYSSLRYTVGAHWLSILNVIVCIYHLQTPCPSHSLNLPLGNHKSVLHVCESVSVLYIVLSMPYFRFHL